MKTRCVGSNIAPHRRAGVLVLSPSDLPPPGGGGYGLSNIAELLIDSVVDYAIYMLDLDGRVVSWNAGAQRIKGYAAAEIIGSGFACFYTEEDRAAGMPQRALRIATESGRFSAEGWRCRKDGSRFWAMVVIDPIRQQGRLVGFAKVTRDLTERREAQLELERSRELLFQSQKMEAVGQLTGGLAHDFNNLLTAISGSLEMMKMRVAQGRYHDLDLHIAAAEGASARAAALTHRLLAFSRRQVLDPRPTHADRLVTGMEDLIRRTVGPAIELFCLAPESGWQTLCDPNQLENALLNCCINARDAMPDGGRLTIRMANEVFDAAQAAALDLPAGDYVALRVSDTGIGMPPEVSMRAFDPFFTTKPQGQGTGLGLSMVYGFTRQSGGQARIHSAAGQGTTISLYLPRYRGARQALPQAGAPPVDQLEAAAGQTVLVVDDEALIRLVVVQLLQEFGYAAIQAGNGAAGLRILESDARVDMMITDIGLPGGMNGRQLAEAGRVARPGLKVLFITGYAEASVIGDNPLEPGMHVLTKPFGLEALGKRVKAIIAEPVGGC